MRQPLKAFKVGDATLVVDEAGAIWDRVLVGDSDVTVGHWEWWHVPFAPSLDNRAQP